MRRRLKESTNTLMGAALLRRRSPLYFRRKKFDIVCYIAKNGSGRFAGFRSALKEKPAFAVCVQMRCEIRTRFLDFFILPNLQKCPSGSLTIICVTVKINPSFF